MRLGASDRSGPAVVMFRTLFVRICGGPGSANAIYQRGSAEGPNMLILTRRVGESVVIGEDVTVTVLGVKGNQVRIGINAPKTVAVHREEIFERIKSGRSPGDAPAEGET